MTLNQDKKSIIKIIMCIKCDQDRINTCNQSFQSAQPATSVVVITVAL